MVTQASPKAEPQRKQPTTLPPSSVLLPRDARLLPTEQDAPLLPKVEETQPLPRALFAYSTVNCQDPKAPCKRKTGNEKGPVDDRTAFEHFLKELALFVGVVNLQLDEDLNRPDGKKFGIVGGRNADGPDTPVTQMVAMLMELTPALKGEVDKFIKKVNKSVAKKAPLKFELDELSEEATKWLASHPGSAKTLCEAGTIGPFKTLRQFTLGLENAYQTHHILEKKWFEKRKMFAGDSDLVPSVILTKDEHKAITAKLTAWINKNNPKTPAQVWKMYNEVYANYPHWLAAIKPYFE